MFNFEEILTASLGILVIAILIWVVLKLLGRGNQKTFANKVVTNWGFLFVILIVDLFVVYTFISPFYLPKYYINIDGDLLQVIICLSLIFYSYSLANAFYNKTKKMKSWVFIGIDTITSAVIGTIWYVTDIRSLVYTLL